MKAEEVFGIKESIFASGLKDETMPTLVVDAFWKYNAFLEPNWVLYVEGYKNAADYLVERSVSEHEMDFLVYPIIFLYRHYLELQLKDLFQQLREYHNLSCELSYNHDLTQLWNKIRPLMEKNSNKSEDIENNNHIEARIKEFVRIDKGSFSFRYPVDKQGTSSLRNVPKQDGQDMINLLQVKGVVTSMATILSGVSEYIGVMLEYKDDMEREYSGEKY